MKNKLIIIPVIIVGLIAITHYFVVRNVEDVELQKYSIEDKDGDIEIRSYAGRIVAKTTIKGTYNEASNRGFRKLASYIFGENKQEEKIAMTAPVWMHEDSQDFEMQFLIPSKYSMSELPQPNDTSISLDRFPGGRYAAIRFGGFANDEKIAAHKQMLLDWLKDNGHPTSGEVYFLGYNSPFKLKHRRNEVLISINE
ncbi:MAG: heme-binding protein [Chitinophagales bacterium]